MTSPAQAPPVVEGKKAAVKATEYVVLQLVDSGETSAGAGDGERWKKVGAFAGTSEQAIKKAAKSDGQFVAIPARSFKPVTLKTETTTKVTLS